MKEAFELGMKAAADPDAAAEEAKEEASKVATASVDDLDAESVEETAAWLRKHPA